MNTPLVSIIIPCYNVERYLNDCIISVINQTFTEWEAILVDDGSNDKTPMICDQWLLKDTRISVIHQSNQGVSAARNKALSVAKGKFVCFVDSDDTVGPNYLQGLIDTQEKYKSRLTISGFILKALAKSIIKEIKVQEAYFYKNDFVKLYTLRQFHFLLRGPYCKLFETDIIKSNDIRFDTNIHFGEDSIFVLRYCLLIDSIAFSADVSYNYFRRPTGLVNSKCYRQNVVNEIKAFTEIFQDWANRLGITFYEIPYFLDTFGLLYERFRIGSADGMGFKEYMKSYDYINLQIFHQYFPAKTAKSKIYAFMLKYSPKLLGLMEYFRHK